jgi:hypothetical protein
MHSFASKTFFASSHQAIHHAEDVLCESAGYASRRLLIRLFIRYPSGHSLIYPPMYSAALIDCHRCPPTLEAFCGHTLHQIVVFVRPPSSQYSCTFNAPGRVRTSTTTPSSCLPAAGRLGLTGRGSVAFKSARGRGQCQPARWLPLVGASDRKILRAGGRLCGRCHGPGAHAAPADDAAESA